MNKNILIQSLSQKYDLPQKTVEQVVAFVYGISKEKLFLTSDFLEDKTQDLEKALKRICDGYPVEYLTNRVTFFGLDLFVNDDVLIPRDDTELLVEEAISYISGLPERVYYFDVGTGSGCIPVSLFSKVGERLEKCFLFEISEGALNVAKKNVETITPSEKFGFFCEDFHNFPQIFPTLGLDYKKHIVITANLPYVKVHDIYLGKEVLDHEPTVALFGGTGTGFELYDDFFEIVLSLKKKFGFSCTVFAEIGYDQAEVSREFFTKKDLNFSYFRDTGFHDRVVMIRL